MKILISLLLAVCLVFISFGVVSAQDLNADGYVNVLDMILIGQSWQLTGEPGWLVADINMDGSVNVLDMIIVGQNWTG